MIKLDPAGSGKLYAEIMKCRVFVFFCLCVVQFSFSFKMLIWMLFFVVFQVWAWSQIGKSLVFGFFDMLRLCAMFYIQCLLCIKT